MRHAEVEHSILDVYFGLCPLESQGDSDYFAGPKSLLIQIDHRINFIPCTTEQKIKAEVKEWVVGEKWPWDVNLRCNVCNSVKPTSEFYCSSSLEEMIQGPISQ